MKSSISIRRVGRRRAVLAALNVLLALSSYARAQTPEFDVAGPPGAPEGRGKLGPVMGASGTSGFDAVPVTPQESLFGGRPGPSATRVPVNLLSPPQLPIPQPRRRAFQPPVLEPTS